MIIKGPIQEGKCFTGSVGNLYLNIGHITRISAHSLFKIRPD